MPGRREASPLALTMGEPAGVGGELALAAWTEAAERGLPPFFVIDDPDRLAALAETIGLAVPLRPIADPEETTEVFPEALPVLPLALDRAVSPGRPDTALAAAVIAAIDRAAALALAGRVAGVVTSPIHKETLYAAGFRHPGHTEYLAELCGVETRPVMMLAAAGLRVVPVTIHCRLREAIERLTTEAIVACGTTVARALDTDFGIPAPRLAVAALNPHAGEGGALGDEEARVIAPAVAELRRSGVAARGPEPADTLFHAAARATYDACLCMYHDQALIPLKTLDFAGGVNITLGLPIVRTSPDHGTALDLAGTGRADPTSLIAAITAAAAIAARRAGKGG